MTTLYDTPIGDVYKRLCAMDHEFVMGDDRAHYNTLDEKTRKHIDAMNLGMRELYTLANFKYIEMTEEKK